ncbi:MAG: folate-binding protein YgfZ [Duodenibacillus sp.]|nr:folate-binding protein YgfZ [Duodenibacillus sp.]
MTSNSLSGRVRALPDLAAIALSGPDAAAFLQGQLTQDVTKLREGVALPAGWCSPKGRLIAVMQLLKDAAPDGSEVIYAVVPAGQAAMLAKRLRMYILRSKVRLDPDPGLAVAGVLGEAAGLKAWSLPSGHPDALAAFGLPAGRALALVPAGEAPAADDGAWKAASALAGEAWIAPAAQELFTPHAVNLELAGGVSFSKGCYTGQEVVARVEHIGRPPRRTGLFAAEGEAAGGLAPGAELSAEARVVASAPWAGRTALLIELPAGKAGSDFEAAPYAFSALPLPYGWTRA